MSINNWGGFGCLHTAGSSRRALGALAVLAWLSWGDPSGTGGLEVYLCLQGCHGEGSGVPWTSTASPGSTTSSMPEVGALLTSSSPISLVYRLWAEFSLVFVLSLVQVSLLLVQRDEGGVWIQGGENGTVINQKQSTWDLCSGFIS